MPCHCPTKTSVIFSLTSVVESSLTAIVALKSEIRQLFWAAAVEHRNASSSAQKSFTTEDTQKCEEVRSLRHILEFHRDRFAVGGCGFEELLLLEAEHAGQDVGRERLDLGVQVSHNGVVVAA